MNKSLVVLLSRQRQGTNALRAVIGSHPEIHCFEEVLNPDPHYLAEPWSYFGFLRQHCSVEDLHPSNQLSVFERFVQHLHRLHNKPKTLIDVKYNCCWHVSESWPELTKVPLFLWMRDQAVPVIRLSRHNLLRVFVSNEIAQLRRVWHDQVGQPPDTPRVALKTSADGNSPSVLEQLENWKLEDREVTRSFIDYDRLLHLEYAETFPRLRASISDRVVEQLADFLDVDDRFDRETWCMKSTSRPLWEAVENWDEVCRLLTGTLFDYCLDDEPAYRGGPDVITAAGRFKLMNASRLVQHLANRVG